MTRLRAALLALAALALTGCEGAFPRAAPGPGAGAGDAALCARVGDALLRGQRNSFGLNFRAAEDAFSELLALYALEDVAARCPRAPGQAYVLMNQALAHSSQERFVTADGLFDRAESLLDGAEADRPSAARDRALLTAYRAQDQLNRALLDGARGFVEAATESLAEGAQFAFAAGAGLETDLLDSGDGQLRLIEQASNRHTLSHVRLLEGDLPGAEAAIDEALDLIRAAPAAGPAYRPRFLSQRSLIRLERGNPQGALADATEAADSFAALMPDTPLEARARLREARALVDLQRLDAALAAFERAFEVYEENPVAVDYAALWPFFSLALQIAADDPARADEMNRRLFRAAQVVRPSITAQTVAGAAALLGEGDDAKARAVRAWRDANERYATLKALQVLQLRDPLAQPEQARSLAGAVGEAQSELTRLREARDRIAPEYAAALSRPVTLDAVQGALAPGEALVQILPGRPRSLLLIADADRVTVEALPATDLQIAVLVSVLRRGVETDREGRVPAFRADLAFSLFNLLFPGYRDRLLDYERLIFSTQGALQSLPLELLVTDPPDRGAGQGWQSGDYRGVPWLGAARPVSYVPSPRNLVDIRGGAGDSRASRDVAAFADFRAGVDPDKVLRLSNLPDSCRRLAEAVDRVGELPGTADEARAIAARFGDRATVATGSAFNEDAVRAAGADGGLADYRVLHFATHGILWPTPDCFTEPALTVTATGSEDSDGLLSASEIRTLSLDAQLVVLSACNTASGFLVQASASAAGARAGAGAAGAGGESLSGLARAFFAAGARAVLATHWPVADVQTTQLMDGFYRRLDAEGADFAEALRGAQADLRARPETAHPVFWAPFVLIGDASRTLR